MAANDRQPSGGTWARFGLWYVLLDGKMERVLLAMLRSIWIFPDVLSWDDMLNNFELVSHGLYNLKVKVSSICAVSAVSCGDAHTTIRRPGLGGWDCWWRHNAGRFPRQQPFRAIAKHLIFPFLCDDIILIIIRDWTLNFCFTPEHVLSRRFTISLLKGQNTILMKSDQNLDVQ